MLAALVTQERQPDASVSRPLKAGPPGAVWLYQVVPSLAYAFLVGLAIRHHEPWADEAQAWLIARDAHFTQIWGTLGHLEGSPVLWHSLLYVLIRVGLHYSALNVVSGVLGLAAATVVFRYAPFPRFLRICIPFTYFLCYQYAVVARSYSLAPVLLFTAAACYVSKVRQLAVLPLIVLASVSAQAFLISVAFAVSTAFTYLVERDTLARGIQKKLIWSALIYLAVASLIAWAAWPSPQASFAITPNWSVSNFAQISRYAFDQAFGSAYWPLVIIVLSLPQLWRGPGLLFFALSALFVCAFGSLIYSNVWHHGFLVLAWLVALWISYKPGWANWFAIVALTLFVLIQCRWTYKVIQYDWSSSYSGSREMAKIVNEQLLPESSIFGIGFPSVAVQPYFRSNLFANYPARNESFWLWSKANAANDATEHLGFYHPSLVLLGYSNEGDRNLWRHVIIGSGYREIAHAYGNTYWETDMFQPENFELFKAETATHDTILSNRVSLSNRAFDSQLLGGFGDIQSSNGRWVAASSSIALQNPTSSAARSAEFHIDFNVPPDTFRKLGPMKLTVYISGYRLKPIHLDHPGPYQISRDVAVQDLYWRVVPISLQFEKSALFDQLQPSERVAVVSEMDLLAR